MVPLVLQAKAAVVQVRVQAAQIHLREVAVQGKTIHRAVAESARGQGLLALLVQPAQVDQ